MKRALFTTLLMAFFAAHAASTIVATLGDATGDDNGDGRLTYPQQGAYEAGDLDLQQLQISRDEQGFWIEAKFQNSIRNPANASGDVGAESLAEFARKGFYQFNLDIYIDIDRVKGSGTTFTLPGRQARIAPDYAWERAIILTPRPEAMRGNLLEVLAQQYPQRSAREIEAGIDQTIFFPTKTRVNGRTIGFLVPQSFIGKTDGSDWAVTAFVTAAERSAGMKFSFVNGNEKKPLEEFTLGVLQPQPGHPRDAVGYGTGTKPSPIFDLLTRSANQQTAMLASGADLTGVSWGPHAGNDLAASVVTQVETPNATVAPTPPPGKKSFLSNPLDYLVGMFSTAGPSVASSSSVTPAPVQVLLDPQAPSAKTQAPNVQQNPTVATPTLVPVAQTIPNPPAPVQQSGPATAPALAPAPAITPAAEGIAGRLQSLQQLYDNKVITEAEYKQQRQRILGEL
jgi:hypothetical protein